MLFGHHYRCGTEGILGEHSGHCRTGLQFHHDQITASRSFDSGAGGAQFEPSNWVHLWKGFITCGHGYS